MQIRPRRSALFMPGSNGRAMAKARTLACDVVIFDLEDAVAPEQKVAARDRAIAAAREGGFGSRELVIRANALSTPWGRDDLAALSTAPVDAILLPKVDGPADLAAAAALLESGIPLWAMIETAPALIHLAHIAAAPRLAALVMGTNDIAKELGCRPGADRLPLLGFLAQAVAAARAHDHAVLDGVWNAIDDEAGFAAQCRQGADFGFDGKTLIHPSQIAACTAAFSPSAEEVAWARAVEAAFADPAAAGRGAIRVDGRMVELLHLEQARRTLAMAAATGEE